MESLPPDDRRGLSFAAFVECLCRVAADNKEEEEEEEELQLQLQLRRSSKNFNIIGLRIRW